MDIQKEREAFEAVTNIYHCVYNADLNYYFSGSKFVSDDAERVVNAGWKGWQHAKKSSTPEGYVVVPKEPTQEMEKAGCDYQCDRFLDSSGIYKAMIEAVEKNDD